MRSSQSGANNKYYPTKHYRYSANIPLALRSPSSLSYPDSKFSSLLFKGWFGRTLQRRSIPGAIIGINNSSLYVISMCYCSNGSATCKLIKMEALCISIYSTRVSPMSLPHQHQSPVYTSRSLNSVYHIHLVFPYVLLCYSSCSHCNPNSIKF